MWKDECGRRSCDCDFSKSVPFSQQFVEQYNERYGNENPLNANGLELKNSKYEFPATTQSFPELWMIQILIYLNYV